MGWVVNDTPRPLYSRERPGTHCIGGWVGPGPVWTDADNLAPHRNSIPGPFSPYRVTVPTALFRPMHFLVVCCKCGPLLSPSLGYPILGDFEESAREPTVRFNRQPATRPTGFIRFQLNAADSSNQYTQDVPGGMCQTSGGCSLC